MATKMPSKKDIEKHLKELIGLQLSIARLAGSGRNFHFGKIRKTERGSVGKYALHIQCPWRITHRGSIVTGNYDIWEAAPPDRLAPERTYKYSNTLQDLKISNLLKGYDPRTQSFVNDTELLVVERVKATRFGDATLYLSGDYRLMLFPTNSVEESWRLFRTRKGNPHFVVGYKRNPFL